MKIKLLATVLLLALSTYSFAQNDFKLIIKMRVDSCKIKGNYNVTVTDLNTKISTNSVHNSRIVLFINYDSKYNVHFSRKGCNTKVMQINTKTPERWVITNTIFLEFGKSDTVNIEGARYNDTLMNFEKYKF